MSRSTGRIAGDGKLLSKILKGLFRGAIKKELGKDVIEKVYREYPARRVSFDACRIFPRYVTTLVSE